MRGVVIRSKEAGIQSMIHKDIVTNMRVRVNEWKVISNQFSVLSYQSSTIN